MKVCLLPAFRAGVIGGVAVHVGKLAKYLTGRGWQVVDRPDGEALVHVHAMEQTPQVDVYTNHGIYPIAEGMPAWQRAANRQIFDNLKLARQVITVSRWTASRWEGLTGVRPHIIPNGVDLDEWRNVPRGQWRAKLTVPESVPMALWGKTGLSDVLDPTPAIELALRHPEIVVVIPIDQRLLRSAPKNVRCVGPQPFEGMRLLLADTDVYLATVCENHSIQLLEAMAIGVPVLGYDWGGTSETVTNGKEGRLVDPGDLAGLSETFAEVYEQRKVFGLVGQQTVAERYQWADIVDRTLEVYGMALDEMAAEASPDRIVCSVVIPCYNKAAYVGEAIGSALQQKAAPRYEIIVVDDGSTDGSLAEIRKAAKEHKDVSVIAQANAGVAAARNNGIRQARGKYICCLDADDRIDPLFLNRLSAALDADPGLGIAYSDMIVFGDWPDRGAFQHFVKFGEYDFEQLKRGNAIPCCNLFRRTAWERAGGYKDINPSWEDYELWLHMGKLGWPGRYVPGGLFWYRKLYQEGRDHESKDLAWKLRGIVNRYHRDMYPPAVSFVIPCYRQARFLENAINAALAQTFPDIEVVVVDDGNEEDEARAIRDIVTGYDAQVVRLVRLEHNSGLATARNRGIEEARGQWIVPLDADDKVAPVFVEKCLLAVELDPRRFAYTDSWLWWPDQNKETRLDAHAYDFQELLSRITWSCTTLYAKEAWRQAGGYKPQMSDAGGWEDWEFALTLGEIGVCGVRVPEPLFYYRQHSNGQMRYSAEERKPKLQEAMRRIHSATYRGEFPMSCCGGGRTKPQSEAAPAAPTVPAGVPGSVLVRYVGQRAGSIQWTGPTGRSYSFGMGDPLQWCLTKDADWFSQRRDFQIVPGQP